MHTKFPSTKFIKEDFENFREILEEITDFIIKERGEEVISDSHQPDFHDKEYDQEDLYEDEMIEGDEDEWYIDE